MQNATPGEVLSSLWTYLKEHRITKKELSAVLGYKSPQSAGNLLKSERYLAEEQAEILSQEYGFSKDYLTNGIGGLWGQPEEIKIEYPSNDLSATNEYLFLKFEEKVLHEAMMAIKTDASLEILNELQRLAVILDLSEKMGEKVKSENPEVTIVPPESYIEYSEENVIAPLIDELNAKSIGCK